MRAPAERTPAGRGPELFKCFEYNLHEQRPALRDIRHSACSSKTC
jgi:hypothetical protein